MDFDRKLDRQIADLDDIRIIMETQKKIRDQEIDIDMKIDLVEEAFSLLAKYEMKMILFLRRFWSRIVLVRS